MAADQVSPSATDEQEFSQVRIARTSVGKGVFANQHYSPDWIVGEIVGDMIDDPHYGSDYCIDAGDGRSLEPHPPYCYLNHSCEPNCEMEWLDMDGKEDGGPPEKRRLFLSTLQEIGIGDELTIDYCWPASGAIPCQCQALSCRGWIVCPDGIPDLSNKSAET